jgi:hypothetical protein
MKKGIDYRSAFRHASALIQSLPSRHRLKGLVLLLEILEIGVGKGCDWILLACFGKSDEPVRIPVGERTKQHAVDDCKHGRVRSDSERERGDYDCRKDCILSELAPSVADILNDRFEKSPTPEVAAFLAETKVVSESSTRGRLGERNSGLAKFLRPEISV